LIEHDAQLAGRIDASFGARRVDGMRHRSGQDAVGNTACVQHGGRQRRADAFQRREADRVRLEVKLEAEFPVRRLEDAPRGFGTRTVSPALWSSP
jgi:hypothetical protein